MSLQLSFRADLFRAVIRFARQGVGIRVEPAYRAGKIEGAVLAAWSDDAGLFVYDRTGLALRPVQITVPHQFVEAVARSLRGADPGRQRIRVSNNNVACDSVGMIVENAVADAPQSPWRSAAQSHAMTRITAPALAFRRDVMDDIGEAARMLARASGAANHECERASYVLRGGVDGALVTAFPAFPDAFALIGATTPPDSEAWAWPAPWWLIAPLRVGQVETAGAAA